MKISTWILSALVVLACLASVSWVNGHYDLLPETVTNTLLAQVLRKLAPVTVFTGIIIGAWLRHKEV